MRGAVDRRTLLRTGTLAVASVAVPASAHAAALPALVVFDSRVAESRAFAAAFPWPPAMTWRWGRWPWRAAWPPWARAAWKG
jgi:hypothetical protein